MTCNAFAPVVVITILAVSLLLFGRGRAELQPVEAESATPKAKPRKLTGCPVVKYELAEGKISFFNKVGLFRKRWVLIKEFPVYELTGVENLGNWLSLSWNNEVYEFIFKCNGESFDNLVQQIAELQEVHQRNLQKAQQIALCRGELIAALNASLPIVDCSFDILMGLHEKRVNWVQMENYLQTLGGFNFKPELLVPLDLDFSKIAVAIQNQTTKETAQEAFDILRAIYAYFSGFELEALADGVLNFGYVRVVVLAYFMLNDLWFAKVIGEVDMEIEFNAFRVQLADLAAQTNFGADAEGFVSTIVEADVFGSGIWDTRLLFREGLKQL